MRVSGIEPNLRVAGITAAKGFYTDFLGLSTEEFNMGWVARYTSPQTGVGVQLVTHDATSPEDSVASLLTGDIDEAYADARRLGYEIVHPNSTEPCGVRRFLAPRPRRKRAQHRAP